MATTSNAPPPPTAFSLPDLHNARSRAPPSTPRRYELTKPVLIQSFTHHNIIDIGRQIHQRTLKQCAHDQHQAVKTAQIALMAKADAEKNQAVEKAIQKTKAEYDKKLAQMAKAHDKALKEEALRVEGEMKKFTLKQVQKEQERCEEKTRAELQERDEMWQKKLQQMVAEARKEEKEEAAKTAAEKAEEFQRTIDIALAEALDDAKQLQDRMEQCKNKELVRAVDDIRQKERSICQEKINQQRQMYEQQILALNAYLRDIEEQMDEKLRFILSLEKHIKEVEDELVEVRNAFESFISNVKPFQPDPEVQYVLPPLRTIDMSKLGRN